MSVMEFARWAIAVALIGISLWVIVCQFGGIVQARFRRSKDGRVGGYSAIPLIGGLLGAIGCVVAPSGTVQGLWWIPLLADPGCGLLFMFIIAFLLWHVTFGRQSPPNT
jgi:hypothetical protein